MLGRTRHTSPPGNAHLVSGGNVGCPVTGENVEVDRCYACGLLGDIVSRTGEDLTYVVCAGKPKQRLASAYSMP